MSILLLFDKGTSTADAIRQVVIDSEAQLMVAESLEYALESLGDRIPTIIIVDMGLKATESALLCRRVRAVPRFAQVPILSLAVVSNAADIAQILDSGADDCLRKPLILREFAARIRALMRRPTRLDIASPMWITLIPREKSVFVRDQAVELTPTEFDLLDALCRTPGEPIPATTLLQEVWHYPPGVGDPALVRNHVRNLRRKLERDPDRPRIVTSAHGRGYTVSVDIRRR